MSSIEVQIISAAWCKRCQEIKPDAAAVAALAATTLTVVDYDELTESEQGTITKLPTLRFRPSPDRDWIAYVQFEEWKRDVVAAAMTANDTDF